MLPKLHLKWERWKYNKTFEVYVSTLGNIRNKSKAPIEPKINDKGYMVVPVGGSKPQFLRLHRLVLLTWRPTPEAEFLTVDHKNHNKRDNSLENLEWVTLDENQKRAVRDYTQLDGIHRAGVQCVDQTGKIFLIMDKKSLPNAVNALQPNTGFIYETFCNYVHRVWTGSLPKKRYCGITMTPIK